MAGPTADGGREAKRARVEDVIGATESDEWFIGSIDQGTTSSRFIVFDRKGDPVVSHQIEFENLFPKPGWHEHDPLALLSSVEECISQAITVFTSPPHSRSPSQIRCLGVTNQRETTVVWDTTTGLPLYNAIVWPDTRTTALVRELKQAEGADALQDICGLPLSTYPSAVKLVWLLRNVDAVKQAYNEGRLAFGTVDSWLLYRLTGGAEGNGVHVTDATNASRTMFMDLRTREYDDGLLKFFGVDREKIKLPRIVPSASADAFGAMADGPLKGIRITGCLGDQSAALVGHCGFEPGTAKNTYGTGCFLLYNVGPEPVISKSGLLGTIGYDFSGLELGHKDGKDGRRGEVAYALEGSIPVAGAGVNFLRKNLGLFDKASDIDDVTATVEDNGGVVFVTAFSGLFAPYWIDDAKGTLFGITSHTTKGHIARATLEATCYQTKAILDAMSKDAGDTHGTLTQLAVDGGMSDSQYCMQFQADVSGVRVVRPAMRETTCLGAAIAAGLAAGCWRDLDHVADEVSRGKPGRTVFEPRWDRAKSEKLFRRWEHAVEMSRGWVRDEHEESS